METTKDNKPKRNEAAASVQKNEPSPDIVSILGDTTFGLTLRGIIVTKSEVRNFKGTGKNGKPYDFMSQRYDVAAGGSVIELSFSYDKEDADVPDFPIGSVVAVAVTKTNTIGNKISVEGTIIS